MCSYFAVKVNSSTGISSVDYLNDCNKKIKKNKRSVKEIGSYQGKQRFLRDKSKMYSVALSGLSGWPYATVGCSIAVMKKSVKDFGSVNGEKSIEKNVASRKKRKSEILKDSATSKLVLSNRAVSGSWGSDAGDTTESDSVDMEEKCLVEETSVNYGEKSLFMKGDSNQTPKSLRLVTKKALSMPLGKKNFLDDVSDDDIFLDTLVIFPSPLKNLVNVSVRKSFTIDIKLDKVAGKFSQKKLVVVRKLFSKVNGFGGISTLSKFSEIIYASFTSETSLAVVIKKIPVGTLVEAVHTALSEFGFVVSIKMQLADLVAVRWSILIRKDAMKVAKTNADKESWDTRDQHKNFIGSVGGKTCVINQHLVTYAQARCVVVCFDFAASINAVMKTTAVLKGVNLHWSYLSSAKCTKCGNLGHISLSCFVGEKVSPDGPAHKILSDDNKNRLTNIVSGSLFPPLPVHNGSTASDASSKIKPTLMVSMELNDRFATFEHSLASLVKCVDKLAKRLNSLEPMVFQLSLGYLVWKFVTCNICDINVSAKQKDVVCWHFDGMRIFSSKLDKRFLGVGVMIIINNSLTHYVAKSKLSVVILGLYIGVSAKARFSQACEINFFIAKAVNSSTFVVLSGDFNKNRSRKNVSFKFYLDLELSAKKVIDYIFVNESLLSAIASHNVIFVSDFFDTDHNAVLVSVGLGGLLDKFKIKNTDANKWSHFREYSLGRFLENIDVFNDVKDNKNLDAMWKILKKVVISSTDSVFSRHWFSVFNCQKNKQSLKFFKLELLVAKLIKCLNSGRELKVICLFNVWSTLDNKEASKACTMFDCSKNKDSILQHLLGVKKVYQKNTINKYMENFNFNKEHIIKSVLEWPFRKVVLDYLIVDDKLILKPKEVKSSVDVIMEEWTRK
ncbi:hypothetical protein G9A89_008748 [Geosiphon pyriformis]|nr:hypothetical protein G9A89_008748 [Geosiphon pyriformis]